MCSIVGFTAGWGRAGPKGEVHRAALSQRLPAADARAGADTAMTVQGNLDKPCGVCEVSVPLLHPQLGLDRWDCDSWTDKQWHCASRVPTELETLLDLCVTNVGAGPGTVLSGGASAGELSETKEIKIFVTKETATSTVLVPLLCRCCWQAPTAGSCRIGTSRSSTRTTLPA